MPIEYYLAAGVAIILLVLLVFALTGKKSKRVVVQRNFGTDELTKQVARAADARNRGSPPGHCLSASPNCRMTAARFSADSCV